MSPTTLYVRNGNMRCLANKLTVSYGTDNIPAIKYKKEGSEWIAYITVFHYGSNNLEQLAARMLMSNAELPSGFNRVTKEAYLAYKNKKSYEEKYKDLKKRSGKAILEGYKLAFSGKSSRWQNGSVATIVEDKNSKVFGYYTEMRLDEVKRLDKFESVPKIYRRKLVQIGNREAFTYEKLDNQYYHPVSEEYLDAIRKMHREWGFDTEIEIIKARDL